MEILEVSSVRHRTIESNDQVLGQLFIFVLTFKKSVLLAIGAKFLHWALLHFINEQLVIQILEGVLLFGIDLKGNRFQTDSLGIYQMIALQTFESNNFYPVK